MTSFETTLSETRSLEVDYEIVKPPTMRGNNQHPTVTDKEKEYIRDHSFKKSIQAIANDLGRGWNTIDRYQLQMGLKYGNRKD